MGEGAEIRPPPRWAEALRVAATPMPETLALAAAAGRLKGGVLTNW